MSFEEIMKKIGMKTSLSGCQYLKEIIVSYNPTKPIVNCYRELAKKYRCNWTTIERPIRTAIESVYMYGNVENLNDLFGEPNLDGKLTNKEFINRLYFLLAKDDTAKNLSSEYPSLFECSKCGHTDSDTYSSNNPSYNFCPNCGRKIVKEKQNG